MSLQIIFIISLAITSYFYVRENQLNLRDLLRFEHAKVVLLVAAIFTLIALIGNRKEQFKDGATRDERLILESEEIRHDFDDDIPGVL